MVEIMAVWTGSDHLESHSMPTTILLDIPVLTSRFTSAYGGMFRDEIVMQKDVYHLSLLVAVDISLSD